jgi:hypothetical protein
MGHARIGQQAEGGDDRRQEKGKFILEDITSHTGSDDLEHHKDDNIFEKGERPLYSCSILQAGLPVL